MVKQPKIPNHEFVILKSQFQQLKDKTEKEKRQLNDKIAKIKKKLNAYSSQLA